MMKAIHMRLLKLAACCLIVGCVAIIAYVHGSEKTNKPLVNVVVLGGTGDLATRYLWQGFFNLYQETKDDYSFSFVGAARMPSSEGDGLIQSITQHNVSCGKAFQPGQGCQMTLNAYRAMVTYRKLKTADDYAEFCKGMEQEGVKEHGRLFYLSVPPFAYGGIAENIAKGCRPTGDAWLRVVLEKPFGRDDSSAQELASQLSKYLREEEIYRIDHYLGKIGVQSILPFRALNDNVYKKLWSREHIDRVEIVMKEKIDSKGRLAFYDEYGVIRDVMQNHLTEIFALIAMEVPTNLSSRSEFLTNKIRLLHQTKPVNADQAVIGQYDGYVNQWREELGKDQTEETLVPTFAAATFYIENPQWKDVPFVLVAGKKLDERIGYVRVVFKDNAFCVTKKGNDFVNCCARHQQVVFYTGNPGLKYPTILVSKHLPKPTVPESWLVPDADPDVDIFGSNLSDFYYFSPPKDQDAYTSLISACFHGDRQLFVGTKDLMASWNIWTPMLQSLEGKRPRIYAGGDDTGTWLDFRVKDRTLKFIHNLEDPWEFEGAGTTFSSISDKFRARPLVTGTQENVVAQLALHLLNIARQSIQERGSFHIALPGGNSPRPLFAHLATKMSDQFPWEDTHIWMVDERCVPFTDSHSNFKQLHDSLLQYINIPYFNINPMPVKSANRLCDVSDRGTETYQDNLEQIPDGRLDYVLLGMGADGHVASLFPNHPTVEETTAKVVLSDGGPSENIPQRMTMTFQTINKARHVGILILSKWKRNMVSVLRSDGVGDALRYPVMGVDVEDGEQVWYIDHEALL